LIKTNSEIKSSGLSTRPAGCSRSLWERACPRWRSDSPSESVRCAWSNCGSQPCWRWLSFSQCDV